MYRYLLLLVLTGCMSPIDKINYRVNQVPYISDIENYGVVNYKATPEEFYARGGDCEDYAIAKHAELNKFGIQNKDIKYIFVSLPTGEQHILIKVTHDGKDYILDNRSEYLENMEYVNREYKHLVAVKPEIIEKIWN